MAWELDSDRPIYAQIVERLKLEIVSGLYAPGARLPSVRELAAAAGVNPNTMQHFPSWNAPGSSSPSAPAGGSLRRINK